MWASFYDKINNNNFIIIICFSGKNFPQIDKLLADKIFTIEFIFFSKEDFCNESRNFSLIKIYFSREIIFLFYSFCGEI